jgi:hypothetical protein
MPSRDPFLSQNFLKVVAFFFSLLIVSCVCALSFEKSDSKMGSSRRGLFRIGVASVLLGPQVVHGFSNQPVGQSQAVDPTAGLSFGPMKSTVAYRSLSLDIPEFGVRVPVAMWHPTEEATDDDRRQKELKYNHRISIKKIGQLLAGWEFLPDFASKDFQLEPTLMGSIVDGTKMSMPSHGPVVFLAHGYLGSRFDLSHLAESLAQEGTSKKLDVMLAPLPALTSHSL